MRAGRYKHLEEARRLMAEAGDWCDKYDHHVAEMCMLIVWGGLYTRLIQDERDKARYLDGNRLRYLMKRKDWANDMALTCELNLTHCGERARHYEMEARMEWELAERREGYGEYQD